MRARWLWLVATALVTMVAVSTPFFWPTRLPYRADWTPQQFCEALVAAGLDYEIHTVPSGPESPGDCLLRQPSTAQSAAELRAILHSATAFPRQTGHLFVGHAHPHTQMDPGINTHFCQLGSIVLRGHPDEIRRVLAVLGSD